MPVETYKSHADCLYKELERSYTMNIAIMTIFFISIASLCLSINHFFQIKAANSQRRYAYAKANYQTKGLQCPTIY